MRRKQDWSPRRHGTAPFEVMSLDRALEWIVEEHPGAWFEGLGWIYGVLPTEDFLELARQDISKGGVWRDEVLSQTYRVADHDGQWLSVQRLKADEGWTDILIEKPAGRRRRGRGLP